MSLTLILSDPCVRFAPPYTIISLDGQSFALAPRAALALQSALMVPLPLMDLPQAEIIDLSARR